MRYLFAMCAVAAAVLGSTSSNAVQPCPDPVCTVITGTVTDPHGHPAPSYEVVVKRADGYNETTKTNAAGRYEFHLPKAVPNNCYQVVGIPDAYYTKSSTGVKACASTTANLLPKYRINGVTGLQKVYLGDASSSVTIPISVSALSRSNPAPFAGDALPYGFDFYNPSNGREASLDEGEFAAPVVRKIGDGVWQTLWSGSITLPSHAPGYYDMDWGEDSVFSPMMDCRMVWFGYGTSSISPSSVTPATVVTLNGQRFGAEPGSVVIKGSGQVTTIQPLTWSDSKVTFLVPAGAKSGWVAAIPPSRIKTNAQYLAVKP